MPGNFRSGRSVINVNRLYVQIAGRGQHHRQQSRLERQQYVAVTGGSFWKQRHRLVPLQRDSQSVYLIAHPFAAVTRDE